LPLQAGPGPWPNRYGAYSYLVESRQTTGVDSIAIQTKKLGGTTGDDRAWYNPPPNDATNTQGVPAEPFEITIVTP